MATNEQTSPEVARQAASLLRMSIREFNELWHTDSAKTFSLVKSLAASALTQAPDQKSLLDIDFADAEARILAHVGDQEQLATSGPELGVQSSQAPSLMAQDPSSLKPSLGRRWYG